MASPKYKPAYRHAWALLVGIDSYASLPPLDTAIKGVQELAGLLQSDFDFDPDRIIRLENAQATQSAIRRALTDPLSFEKQVGPDDRVLIYFAGHGITFETAEGDVGCIAPYDADRRYIDSTIPMDELTRLANRIHAKHVLFLLDACFSGYATVRDSGPGEERLAADLISRPVRQVITAGTRDQAVSDAWGPGGHSLFTGFLIDGLRGAAPAPGGILRAFHLAAYLQDQVASHSRSRQTPQYAPLIGSQGGDFVFSTQAADRAVPVSEIPARPPLLRLRLLWQAARRRWKRLAAIGGAILAVLVALVVLLRVIPSSTPDWLEATPMPSFPDEAAILSADLSGCDQTTNFQTSLERVLADAELGDAGLAVEDVGDALQEQSERAGVVAAVWGECIGDEMVELTVAFPSAPPYPVALLQEPDEITLQLDAPHAESFAQAAILYATGQYDEAQTALGFLVNPDGSLAFSGDEAGFYWLRGNTFLRLADWSEAINAYSDALDSLGEDSPLTPDLLANRGLAGYFAKQAGALDPLACATQSREDLERALTLAPDRPDLHVLAGQIMLQCPRDDQDIEEKAVEQASLALELGPEFAPSYALRAWVGLSNLANPQVGNPLVIESHACQAAQIDPGLPDPHRTLGMLYRQYGLSERARQEFEAYGRLAVLEWQRRDAADLWAQPDPSNTLPPPAGLGGCE